ncbi:MAG TPA: sigma 54-dependent Fis family transcriptional regulator, partial [Thermoanaerobaculia bacterium]|nr:sigma 54-dependent Fis family transcriptional regulator [Thermoanaerobaculia bacterium]
SRRHAQIDVLPDGGVVIADAGSKNGTFVAGRRVRQAAVCGFGVVSFGPVQALLQPADPTWDQVLLEPPGEPGGREPARRGSAAPLPSTRGLHPLERLAESLGEVLPPLVEGLMRPEEAADELVHRWVAVLPIDRADILRAGAAGESIVAAASGSGRGQEAVSFQVEGPEGWTLRLRAAADAELRPLRPLFRLVLDLLASGSGLRLRSGRRGDRTDRPDRPDRPHEPPPGLGKEMTQLYRRAGKVARGDVAVLILGESGAGKEVLARWIHAGSRRAAGPFLAINCAALPRELLEAELFGIERGVATGVEARPGILERATGGTVFLDEIGDMAAETQAKVLRVLESTSLYRVGGRNPVAIDVRFLSATNRDLESMVEEGSFRRDLYHRLAAMEVKLPPLRERREEIPALAARFFHRELERNGVASPGINRAALGALVQYPWPGNVRELQNEIARAALLLEPGEPLDIRHLSRRVRGAVAGGVPPVQALTLDETVARAEREAFRVALAAAGGDAARAMELLGVSRTTYYRKLKELGLGESGGSG